MAALVLARMPPATILAEETATILAEERRLVAVARKSGAFRSRQVSEEDIIRRWQELWDSTPKAAWTKRLIPCLRSWWHFGPRRISFHMVQALTGHGCFQMYLAARGRAESPACVLCDADNDDAEHTLFNCSRWEDKRRDLERAVGMSVLPEDVGYLLCGPERE
ncbi:uncharacterized protein LOC112596441 [Melanaphis sacchari]|uniref:uncharacterized protein LOC112596441 n=1 Tax=Melanaphis sacchari TaxID=742174 RepID=UPI000DC13184|nr:uncharacterized protein LOC112596441 [Melanaphis sacchari]